MIVVRWSASTVVTSTAAGEGACRACRSRRPPPRTTGHCRNGRSCRRRTDTSIERGSSPSASRCSPTWTAWWSCRACRPHSVSSPSPRRASILARCRMRSPRSCAAISSGLFGRWPSTPPPWGRLQDVLGGMADGDRDAGLLQLLGVAALLDVGAGDDGPGRPLRAMPLIAPPTPMEMKWCVVRLCHDVPSNLSIPRAASPRPHKPSGYCSACGPLPAASITTSANMRAASAIFCPRAACAMRAWETCTSERTSRRNSGVATRSSEAVHSPHRRRPGRSWSGGPRGMGELARRAGIARAPRSPRARWRPSATPRRSAAASVSPGRSW